MNILYVFAVLSFGFSVTAYVPYVKSILSDTATRPTISTWLSWWIMDSAILVGMATKDAIAPQMVAYVIGIALIIGACLLRRARLGWTKLDSVCMALVLAAVVLWVLSGDADFMIVMSLVAVSVGSVPLLINIWSEPGREPFLPWVLVTIGGLFGVAAISEWSIAGAATQVVFAVLQVAFLLLIARKFFSKKLAN